MNRSLFKTIALISMTVDHIAAFVLMPYIDAHAIAAIWMTVYYVMRSIGRLAFVMFAFMIAEGFYKTRDVKKYFLRLFYYAAGIEIFVIIYYFISGVNEIMVGNVIWPLVFGLGSLILLSQKQIWKKLLVIPVVFLAGLINIQYSFYGVVFIIIFGMYRNNIVAQFLMAAALNALYIQFIYVLATRSGVANAWQIYLQWFSMVAFVFIVLYNGKKSPRESKWFFYVYYPAHVVLLFLISSLLS